MTLDSSIVGAYFLLIFFAGYIISRKYRDASAQEFLTGGRTLPWYRMALTMFAMASDPGIIGLAGIGFIWGLYPIQWTSVHIWITASFAAMFMIPIYWRTNITTTPELLEKRFNVQCRAFFSLVMVAVLVITLAFGVYLGALLLKNFLGWSFWMGVVLICAVAGFYVISGGMRTVLALDFYQGLFLLAAQFTVGGMALWKLGGIRGLASIEGLNKAGTPLVSMIPPRDYSMTSDVFYPLPAILTWGIVVGVSWLACNFGLVQRLLTAKSERDAQKGIMLMGAIASFSVIPGYIAGVMVRTMMPDILPDEAYLKIVFTMFPVGVRGLIIAGLMAALLSTIDGMFTASSALLTEDIYLRFLRPGAGNREIKHFSRIVQATIMAITFFIIPAIMKSESAVTFLQMMYGDFLGVVIALYLAGIFSRRATPRAALFSMISGIAVAVMLDIFTPLNFAYVGLFSFLYALTGTLVLSRFENPLSDERLKNLTIYTVEDAKGPFIGLKAWPGMWKWAIGLVVGWFTVSLIWELYVASV